MPRRLRSSQIENRTQRLRLKSQGKPHAFTLVSPGVRLGYRRNRGCGVWVLKATDGHGGEWTKAIGYADDFETADGERILDFWQAQEKARKLAHGNGDSAPATVATALDDYATDLRARDGNTNNVTRVRHHLADSSLMCKPVGLLTAVELRRWRDGLLAKGLKPASALRTCRALAAALNLAARHDPQRITNSAAWRVGLGGLVGTHNPRNSVLVDSEILALIAAARAIDSSFADYLEVHAVTGARSSQIARLTVADLQADRLRLMMPSSAKGRGRRRGVRTPVPITAALAVRLQAIANGRPPSEPLLRRSDGRPWCPERGDHSHLFAKAAERAGLQGHTIYSLRHSSIVRSLLAGVPLRVTAVTHNTSAGQIEATYSAYISDFADEVARRGLLEI